MRVSFTGAQSTGKTTLLNKCKEVYKDYKFVDEVTRYVRKTYDVKINEIGGTETQLYILAEHIKNHLKPDENLILDRCILDGYVYTKYQVGNRKVSEQVLHALIIFVISCTKTVALGLIRIQITKNCDKSTFKDIKQEKVFK